MPASHRSNNPASGALRFPRLRNEIGQLQSAPTGVEHFTFYGRGPNILFLGLGPEPTAAWQALRQHLNLPPAFPETTLKISFVECPSFAKAMQQTVPDWAKATPPFWRELQIKDLPDYEVWKALEQEHVTSEKICIGLYQPGLKLFPSFCAPGRQAHGLATWPWRENKKTGPAQSHTAAEQQEVADRAQNITGWQPPGLAHSRFDLRF